MLWFDTATCDVVDNASYKTNQAYRLKAIFESCHNNATITPVCVVTFLDGNLADMHNNNMSNTNHFLDIKH